MRIIGLDITRSLAILLAMSSHVYTEMGLGPYIPEDISTPLLVMFQISTPIFVMLFGTMLEVVYLPRWESGKKSFVASRLLLRALQCWVLYAISIFVLFLVDDGYSFAFSISCLFFMGNSPYTEILKFYTVALAIAPLLLWVRARVGLAPLILGAVAYQAAWPIFHAFPDAQQDLGAPLQVARVIKFMTGFGSPELAGPSVLHGLTLIIAGQFLGRVIMGRRKKGTEQKALTVTSHSFANRIQVLLISAIGLTALGIFALPRGTFSGLADMTFRMESHVLYFVAGIALASLVTLSFIRIVDIGNVFSSKIWNSLAFFGRSSMFTFAWGNIVLYAFDYSTSALGSSYAFAILLLFIICMMSFSFDLMMRRSETARSALGYVNRPLDKLSRLPFSSESQT